MQKTLLSITAVLLAAVYGTSADTLRVACIGNSITEGATLSTPSQAYPALLNSLLGEGYDVNNYGVGGRVMLKNGDFPIWDETAFTRAIEFDPDIVTILLGTNDSKPWNWGDYKDEYVPDYIDMINTFRALDNNARFLLGYPPPVFSNLGSIRDSVIRNEIIPLIDSVAAVTGTQVVDFYNSMINDSNLFPDGIHPNAAGHQKMAAVLDTVIKALPAAADTTAPWFKKVPQGTTVIYDSAAFLIKVRTSGQSIVKYSASDHSYDAMGHTFSISGGREHQTIIRGEHGQMYKYYLRAMDDSGNLMDTSAAVTFSFDTTKVLYNWTEGNYPDSSWSDGFALFGTNRVSNTKTVLNDVHTVYFRKAFFVEDHTKLVGIGLLVKGQSGGIVYLNGHEIERINMPDDEEILYDSSAKEALNFNKMVVINAQNGLHYLKSAENNFAVEMHVSGDETLALAFDAQLFDDTDKIYFTLGSEWTYFDSGRRPDDQLIEKGGQTAIEYSPVQTAAFELYQNYPNPFNPQTQIKFSLPHSIHVKLELFDVQGRSIKVLLDEAKQAGHYVFTFDAAGLASGVYYYNISGDKINQTKKMILLK